MKTRSGNVKNRRHAFGIFCSTMLCLLALPALGVCGNPVPWTKPLKPGQKGLSTQVPAKVGKQVQRFHPCTGGPDLMLKELRIFPVTLGDKGIDIKVSVVNEGEMAFSASPSHTPTLNIKVRDMSSGMEESIMSEPIEHLGRGTSWTVVPRYEVKGFIELGHRDPRRGECQAEKEITAWVHTFPATYEDDDPQNDDCNLINNKKKQIVKYMVECPW